MSVDEAAETRTHRRVLGDYDAGRPGPTLIALGGVHGNEPGGVYALERVVAKLQERGAQLSGRLMAMAGNLAALERMQRYIHRDLNRAWLPEDTRSLLQRSPAQDRAEDREQRELLGMIERCEAEATGPVIFLDLHTSSAPGPSFACMSDTLANRRIAKYLPVPLILGLEECIDGSVMEHFNLLGSVAIAVEGGRHSDPESVDNLEATVWLALHAARMLPSGIVDLEKAREILRKSAKGQPPVFEILHRQHIDSGDEFLMEPGYQSFQAVRRGEQLASYNGHPIRAPEDCRVLLPLYQGLGEDGFFLMRPVGAVWLKIAAVLRRMRLGSFVHWLPGVTRHPEMPDTLVVQPRIARLFAVQLFHLLGFRRRRMCDGKLCFSRRRDSAIDG